MRLKANSSGVDGLNEHHSFSFVLLVPVVAPDGVGGGGGSRSELIVTWEVIFLSK